MLMIWIISQEASWEDSHFSVEALNFATQDNSTAGYELSQNELTTHLSLMETEGRVTQSSVRRSRSFKAKFAKVLLNYTLLNSFTPVPCDWLFGSQRCQQQERWSVVDKNLLLDYDQDGPFLFLWLTGWKSICFHITDEGKKS